MFKLIKPNRIQHNVYRISIANYSDKKKNKVNISQMPLSYIGVMSDLYVPPSWSRVPILYWPKVLIKRISLFALNTYMIVKFKQEIGVPLNFNKWKDESIEKFININKTFTKSCNNHSSKIIDQLNNHAGKYLIDMLKIRSNSFPKSSSSISWEIKSIDKNPKIVLFNVIPDQNGLGLFVQYIMQLKTTQEIQVDGKKHVVENNDYLVYSMNPITEELLLVGKLFECDYKRGLKGELDMFDQKTMQKFLLLAADIYREDPKTSKQKLE
ncbi:unnamed protein product [Candida verbasci]|uniref:Uncharacterized protein n=1 Tax=Candida verbasci TaxID=1227364 RepID=A0A9W4XAB7_9ASCO|nr:unnamed protein product [Candida verbasci]